LNISTHTPQNANPPDLGPKGYFSEISDDREDGQGSTKLHSQSKFLSRSYINVLTTLHLQWYAFEGCSNLLHGLITDESLSVSSTLHRTSQTVRSFSPPIDSIDVLISFRCLQLSTSCFGLLMVLKRNVVSQYGIFIVPKMPTR